jgi:hypothetical protein
MEKYNKFREYFHLRLSIALMYVSLRHHQKFGDDVTSSPHPSKSGDGSRDGQTQMYIFDVWHMNTLRQQCAAFRSCKVDTAEQPTARLAGNRQREVAQVKISL